MAVHTIKKGLDLPIAGAPEQKIHAADAPHKVAVVAADYVGMRPTMHVAEGDTVKRGQLLFEDKKTPGVRYTAPGAGTVAAVNRGARRALQTVVVELNERERAGEPGADDFAVFEAYTSSEPAGLTREQVVNLLVESGVWPVLRTRPFGKVPAIDATPTAVFVTAMDTNPLAASVSVVLAGNEKDFETGLSCVAKLTEGATYLCKAAGVSIPGGSVDGITVEEFAGPHPSGTAGLHIHLLEPVHRDKMVWHVNYQDVVGIGRLFTTGKLDVERVVSLAGPSVKTPRLLKTRMGASTDELVSGEVEGDDLRVISGSVLSGRTASGELLGYLGRRDTQVTVLPEGHEREFLGWMAPGASKFSTVNAYLASLFKGKKFKFTTTTNGNGRAMVPIGMYERVMPLDILPTFLLRSLIVNDIEQAEKLGCLELDEEDLALCTFVCPSKYEYGPILRRNLEQIEKEG